MQSGDACQTFQGWQTMPTARFSAGIIPLPQFGIRRKVTAGRRAKLVDAASNGYAYRAVQSDTARRLTFGAAHAGHDAVDLLDQAAGHDAARHLVHLACVEGHPVGSTAGAALLARAHICRCITHGNATFALKQRAAQVPADGGDDGAGRNGQHPGPDNTACHAPAHLARPTCSTDTDDGAGNRVCRRNRYAQ